MCINTAWVGLKFTGKLKFVIQCTHLASVLTFYISVSDISSKTIDVIKTILYYVPCTTVNC